MSVDIQKVTGQTCSLLNRSVFLLLLYVSHPQISNTAGVHYTFKQLRKTENIPKRFSLWKMLFTNIKTCLPPCHTSVHLLSFLKVSNGSVYLPPSFFQSTRTGAFHDHCNVKNSARLSGGWWQTGKQNSYWPCVASTSKWLMQVSSMFVLVLDNRSRMNISNKRQLTSVVFDVFFSTL